ncbi:MAG: hypothetical protein D3916_09660 [Candidatus Electrothrix sp. MAN1_4]|nr:hypothetical protein [Candidatus Electrothrix sp. MAN1_4]
MADQQESEEDASDSQFDHWGILDSALLSQLFPGSLEITVTDLSGRLQANALVWTKKEKKAWQRKQQGKNKKKDPEKIQQSLWKRFLLLENLGLEELDEEQAAIMLDSLVDWLDENDEKEENGAEKEYYSSLDPPYVPTNGPMPLIEDLALVKGWDKGWEQKNLYSEQENKEKTPSPLIACLTTGEQPGKININTAPALVLQALHDDMTEELAAEMISFRENEENKEMLHQVSWYRNVPGFPGNITFDSALITTKSNLFKVTITATEQDLQRIGQGIIQRKENQEQVLLSWKVQ